MKINANITTATGRKAIETALETVQKRCTMRTLDMNRITKICEEVASELNISMSAMTGTTITYTGSERFPNAYRYTPESTHFQAEFNGKAWIVTDISRDFCPNAVKNTHIILSATATTAVLNRLSHMSI